MGMIPLALASDPARSRLVSDTRLINGFAEASIPDAKQPVAVYGMHGLSTFAEPSGSRCRGMIALDDQVYSLHASTLFRIGSAGGTANVGTIVGLDPVIMARNAAIPPQIAIVSDAGVYVVQNNILTQLADADLPPGVNSVAWVSQLFLFFLDDGRFFWSGINNTAIDALDFATAEGSPDGLVRGYVYRQEVLLFGRDSVEVWRRTDTGFERLSGAVIPVGCGSKRSVAELDTVIWLDNTGRVRRLGSGYEAEPISNVGVERAIAAVSDLSEIEALAYKYGGHSFYVLSHDTFTWAYDAMTQRWSERQTFGIDRWQGSHHCFAFNKHLFGSTIAGDIYQADDEAFDEDGNPLVLTVRLPVVHGFPNGAAVSRLDIDVETGVGRDEAVDEDDQPPPPEMMLRWSDDGGKTWTEGRRASLGRKGEYRKRVSFTRCGRIGRQGRIHELSVSAPVFRAVIGASMDAEPLRG